MGRLYQTVDPTTMDYMSQLPQNEMLAAVQNADTQNDQQVQQADLIANTAAKVNYLPVDAQAVQTQQANYQKQVDDLSTQINSDPANYRQHMPLVRSLSRSLTDDITNGGFAAVMGNANKFSQWDQTQHQAVVDGKITPEAYQAARAKFLGDFNAQGGTNYNPNTKVGQQINTEDLVHTPDIQGEMQKAADKIKANSTAWQKDNITGQWIYDNKNTDESVTPQRVAEVARDAVINQPQVQSYMKQGSRLGYLQGAYDSKGQFIQPYTLDGKGNLVYNNDSMLAAPIREMVGIDSYDKKSSEQTVKDNPYGMKAVDLQNQETMAKLNNTLGTQKQQDAALLKSQLDQQNEVFKARIAGTPEANIQTALNNGQSKTVLTPSPDGTTTISPFAGNKGLTASAVNNVLIPDTQTKMADLLAKTKDPNLTDNQRALYQQQFDQEKSLNDQYSNWTGLAHDAAIKNLQSSGYKSIDLNNYYGYENDANGFKTNLQNSVKSIDQQLNSLVNPAYTAAINRGAKGGVPASIPPYTDPAKAQQLLANRDNVTSKINYYEGIGSKISQSENDWYTNNSKATNISLNGVGLTPQNKQLIYDGIKTNPEGVQIQNLNTDQDSNTKDIQSKVQSIIAKGGNLSDYFDVKTVNPPAPGVGVTATIRLKKSAESLGDHLFRWGITNNDIYDHDMIMTLPATTYNSLGTNMKNTGTTAKEKSIGDLITNQSKSSFLSSINNTITDKDGSEQPIGVASIYDPSSRQQVNIKVRTNNGTVQAYIEDASGKEHLYTGYKLRNGNYSNPMGEWASKESLTNALFDPPAQN